jgi:hypothetical protein
VEDQDYWINLVVKAAVELFVKQAEQVPKLSASGREQLQIDISAFGNVLSGARCVAEDRILPPSSSPPPASPFVLSYSSSLSSLLFSPLSLSPHLCVSLSALGVQNAALANLKIKG